MSFWYNHFSSMKEYFWGIVMKGLIKYVMSGKK